MVVDTSAIIATITNETDGSRYRAAMLGADRLLISAVAVLETKVAYMSFKFKVAVAFTEITAPHTIAAKIDGAPLGLAGRLSATTLTTLVAAGDETRIQYEIDTALTGKLGSMGQPVMKSKAKEMEREFAGNLRARFATSVATNEAV